MRSLTRNLKLDGLSRTQEASYSKMTVEKVEKTTQYIPQIPPKAWPCQYLRILEMGIKLDLKKEN